MTGHNLNYLERLEAESIHIIRETVAEFKNPVMLYSIGKDSAVLLHLALKAFYPGKLPFPLLHIDTGFKFKEMIEFRDYFVNKINAKLIIKKNDSETARLLGPDDAGTDSYIYEKKTRPLLEAIEENKFDAAFGGARREEEKSRAKERIFSVRGSLGAWNPKNQRPELWHNYNTKLLANQTMRVFPLSNWTEADIWAYIHQENIEVVPLYFAKKRKVVKRDGVIFSIDEFVQPRPNETVYEIICRYRTLGCSPSTGAVESIASTVPEILEEILSSDTSERQNRIIDHTPDSSMEKKKKEGYF